MTVRSIGALAVSAVSLLTVACEADCPDDLEPEHLTLESGTIGVINFSPSPEILPTGVSMEFDLEDGLATVTYEAELGVTYEIVYRVTGPFIEDE